MPLYFFSVMYVKIIEYMPERTETKQFHVGDICSFISVMTAYYEAKCIYFSHANIGHERGEYYFSTKIGAHTDMSVIIKYAE